MAARWLAQRNGANGDRSAIRLAAEGGFFGALREKEREREKAGGIVLYSVSVRRLLLLRQTSGSQRAGDVCLVVAAAVAAAAAAVSYANERTTNARTND